MKLLLLTVCIAAMLAITASFDVLPSNPKNAHEACRFTCFRTFVMNKVQLSRLEGEAFPQMDEMVDMLERKFQKCFRYCDKMPH
ncbi:hypothetical protein NP493_2580g00006 [Ridgeia piscesae]|uniref:Uncharacterized protein n=1 Tax=Ridgeia piscesae TaxID=27915 RepID=A0AAD9JFJ3_RIDPI|nr:hypothetical protein NP493_2580g00006 [Ridgeia piscesae]